jgi:hypothetical protein
MSFTSCRPNQKRLRIAHHHFPIRIGISQDWHGPMLSIERDDNFDHSLFAGSQLRHQLPRLSLVVP